MSHYYQKYAKYAGVTSPQRPSSSTMASHQATKHQQKTSNVQSSHVVKDESSTSYSSHYRFNAKVNLRANVILAVYAVQSGTSLAQLLPEALQHLTGQDKGLFHELVLGTLRQWFALKACILPLLKQEQDNPMLECCLYVGAYQILCTRIAHHASNAETVEACKQLGYPRLSGVVNAILRKVIQEQASYQTQLQQAHGLPSWLHKRLKKDWKMQYDEIVQALKQSAPLTLRINQRQIDKESYTQQLAQHTAFQPCRWAKQGIVLTEGQHIPNVLGFADGWFSVQDEHAQLCGELLPDLTNKIVIDACSAPGGKLSHLLEQYQVKQVFALDNDAQRLTKISENLQRLQLEQKNVELICADASQWQSPSLVDCILLDVPCSATGVIRRHPDIRLLRQSQDIASLVALQRSILEQMWQQLASGGVLIYMTCSILKAENEQQMIDFFAHHIDAEEQVISAEWGIAQQYGRQLLPTEQGGDGFYYCVIRKR